MKAYDAFLIGCKPSYLSAHIDKDKHKRLLTLDYPSKQIFNDLTFFFASQELKDDFAIKSHGLDFHSPEYKEILGIALGYPPIACSFYADTMRNKSLEKCGAVFDYCGRHFGGHVDDAQVISEWLWSNIANYPPSEILMTYQDKDYHLLPDVKKPVLISSK